MLAPFVQPEQGAEPERFNLSKKGYRVLGLVYFQYRGVEVSTGKINLIHVTS